MPPEQKVGRSNRPGRTIFNNLQLVQKRGPQLGRALNRGPVDVIPILAAFLSSSSAVGARLSVRLIGEVSVPLSPCEVCGQLVAGGLNEVIWPQKVELRLISRGDQQILAIRAEGNGGHRVLMGEGGARLPRGRVPQMHLVVGAGRDDGPPIPAARQRRTPCSDG
jgi:hypothetical protein